MAEYNKLKSMLLDMQHKSRTDGKQTFENAMDQRRAMVDTMFEYLDLNQDGRLSGGELTEVRYARVIVSSYCLWGDIKLMLYYVWCINHVYSLIRHVIVLWWWHIYSTKFFWGWLNCTAPSFTDLNKEAFGRHLSAVHHAGPLAIRWLQQRRSPDPSGALHSFPWVPP